MKFIVFEGLEGCGKTTQMRLLTNKLEAMNIPHTATRQPSDNPIGKLMRSATDGFTKMENETMALLVAADRYQHVYDVITPALEDGKIVLCDRYYYSSLAYQGIDPGAFARVAAYNGLAMAYCKPDITFFLDVRPEECMRRIQAYREYGGAGYEEYGGLYDSLEQLTLIRERYIAAFEQLKETDPVVFIDGIGDQKTVAAQILGHLGIKE
ncbi:MAG: dTMP kinase [Defluviitaleaceae bacterium]|nr:dTMP kinase [Defluviitaleaceae bacterium]